MIAPEPGTKADPYFRLPKQTTTVYWADSDICESYSHSSEKYDKNTRKTVRICNLLLHFSETAADLQRLLMQCKTTVTLGKANLRNKPVITLISTESLH